jgi:RNA polymerase sigma-70 factor (ECF subfamily)
VPDPEVDDLALLDRWRAGDKVAGEDLFKRHFDSLVAFFATKCNDADELVQRTLLACVNAKDQFRAQSTFRTYLFAIARHELYQYLKRTRKDRERIDFEITSVAELVTTPATKLARHAEQRQMVDTLRRLPVEQQTLLELYYWEDLEVAQLAEVFELTPNAVRVRLHRARQALRDQLVASGNEASTAWLDASPKSTETV